MKKKSNQTIFLIIPLLGMMACNHENNGLSSSDLNSTISQSNTLGNVPSSDINSNANLSSLETPTQKNILVTYFSCTNTTKSIAQKIVVTLESNLYEIVPEIPYTESDLKYYTNCRADQEQSDPTSRPAIHGRVENMEQYDILFLGYPIWHGQAPRIISTFLESYDFSNKTIIPFCTSQSSPIGSSDTNLHSLASNANWLNGKRFSSSTTQETINEWVHGLSI